MYMTGNSEVMQPARGGGGGGGGGRDNPISTVMVLGVVSVAPLTCLQCNKNCTLVIRNGLK